jgi:diguanylate cyclase (GGDEF)-like protein
MPRLLHTSLRARFILGMGVMLLPLVVLAVAASFSLQRVIVAFDDVVQEAFEEIALISRLQLLIRRAKIVMHDHFILGLNDREGPQRFLDLSRQVERGFEDANTARFDLVNERVLIRSAQEEWQRAQTIGRAILAIPNPVRDPAALKELARLDAYLEQAQDMLDQVRNLAQGEMTEQLGVAYSVRRRALLVIVLVFMVGFGTAAIVGRALALSVLRPLRVLEEGTNRFGNGDLSHRVSLAGQDELGHLGGTLNDMAEKLAKSQKALEDLSVQDGLTGLFNYREFHRRLTEEVQRSRRYGRPFSLLILDIDDFKAVNDTYGHLAGDETLRALAALIRREVRPVDEVARYGGEEFAILLPETSGPGAFAMAERIRDIIATHPLPIAAERTVALTVSIGTATYPEDADAEERLIAAADHALYTAKNGGRNRVCRGGNHRADGR